MTETWDPEQYEKFRDQRRRPFADLTARVAARRPEVVVDLGCGAGAATIGLAQRWPDARIVGVDSSAEMLDRARGADPRGRVEWVLSEVESWDPAQVGAKVDVIISNSLLQWAPSNLTLIPDWVTALSLRGWF